MIKDQEYLSEKAYYCLDLSKKLGATDTSVIVSNSISEKGNIQRISNVSYFQITRF